MSAKREPLPYPHPRIKNSAGVPFACQYPEAPSTVILAYAEECPGCVSAFYAHTVHDPYAGYVTDKGITTFLAAALEETDDFDPARVLFERALAERGVA